MSLPTAYLTSVKRVPDILAAIQAAQAPNKFSQRFLETLGFKSKGDRLIINVLKSVGFLDDAGKPTSRYYEYLDQTQSERVLARGIREAYADLFAVNVNAQQMSKTDIVNKLRTLTQGQYSDAVLGMMAMTFLALCKSADFLASPPTPAVAQKDSPLLTQEHPDAAQVTSEPVNLGGLVYNIQIVLPETRDTAVYDALFKSLKEHIL